MSDHEIVLYSLFGCLIIVTLVYVWNIKGLVITWLQYLFKPEPSNQQLYRVGSAQQNTVIMFHGFGSSCERFMDVYYEWFTENFSRMLCFEYPRPALDHWLKTFYKTTYRQAKDSNGIILLYGFSLGGWFALHAAQYIAKHDPNNKHRIRVIAIAPMTHWRNFNPQENNIPKKNYVMDSNYGDTTNWQVFASTEDEVFKFDDIKKTYEGVASINEVRGGHRSLNIRMDLAIKQALDK